MSCIAALFLYNLPIQSYSDATKSSFLVMTRNAVIVLCTMKKSEGSSTLGSSIRSQKIARAKWEFLFGAPTQDQPETKGKTNPLLSC